MLLLLILLGLLLSLVYAWISLAPWMPTKAQDLERINDIIKLKPGQKFVEMGCGNARVCAFIARKNPEAKVVGIELAFPFYLFSKLRALIFGPKNLQIVFGDALKYDISDTDVVYVFGLIETINKPIKQKILSEMKTKGRLVSYVFSLKEWDGKQKTHKEGDRSAGIHVYEK